MIKKTLKYLGILIFIVTATVLLVDFIVSNSYEEYLKDDIDKLPSNKVGLLLGTSKYLTTGNINYYYKYRIEAAVKLYNSGKVKYILISGDNATKEYNEPIRMKNDLIEKGIPEEKIFLDYAGFRTLDSIIRAKEVFGLTKFTIISQPFHNQRAIFIAYNKGLNCYAYNARSVSKSYGFKTNLREKFARVKMMYDIIFNIESKYLGEKIEIN